MSPEEITVLSFYREISHINKHVSLVQHITTKEFFVKKQLSVYDEPLYHMLQEMNIPGIPEIHHILHLYDSLIVIEDYLNYPTIGSILSEYAKFPMAQAVDIALQLSVILQHLHSATPAIIHRDIKPSNVLLSPEGKVYLIDFDAAKTYDIHKSRDTVLMGTADFAAPEQFGFSQSDARTDVYGLGVLLNVMLTGHIPQEEQYDGAAAKIIAKCTAMDPSDRFISMAQLSGYLEALLRRTGTPDYCIPRKPLTHPKPNGWKSWLPPGFRSGKLWKLILACIGYAFIFWAGMMQSIDSASTIHVLFNKLCATVSLLLPVFFLGNYRGISDRFPIANSYIPALRVIGALLWSLIFIFALLLLCVIIDMIWPTKAF